jgi:hypothetical protein
MGYLSIDNLYQNKLIFQFKEIFALEKIDGSSAHIKWLHETKSIVFFSGAEKEEFIKLFDSDLLKKNFEIHFPEKSIVVFGEVYGGKVQRNKNSVYGKKLKFIAFDVIVENNWLNVINAHDVANKLGLEFVDYVQIPARIEAIEFEKDKESVQAIRNGCGYGKKREGIVLRPLLEFKFNGNRIISKHKQDEERETKTKRVLTDEQLKVLSDAKEIAEEWVTEKRLEHVLSKLPENINMDSTKIVIDAMVADVFREGRDEIVESKEAITSIGKMTAKLFREHLQKNI